MLDDAWLTDLLRSRGAPPVLRSRQGAVDEAFTALFPRVRTSRGRSTVDGAGSRAGRAAADTADVGTRRASLR
ncbi:hypothetical protein [Geodermatophilus sp. SYSU D01119]